MQLIADGPDPAGRAVAPLSVRPRLSVPGEARDRVSVAIHPLPGSMALPCNLPSTRDIQRLYTDAEYTLS